MKLLALDQASKITGYAIFDDEKLVKFGKIKLDDEEIGPRLVDLRQAVKTLIHENQIDYIAFEDIQMQTSVGNNVKTFKVLAAVFGVILELCEELKIKYEIVSSNT
jgi:Holliday junction resolvasome RuvABC endonuclease subunit